MGRSGPSQTTFCWSSCDTESFLHSCSSIDQVKRLTVVVPRYLLWQAVLGPRKLIGVLLFALGLGNNYIVFCYCFNLYIFLCYKLNPRYLWKELQILLETGGASEVNKARVIVGGFIGGLGQKSFPL